LRAGQRGFCFVRRRVDDTMVLTTYGRSSGFCIDPIEKKPLRHFFPGTSVFSFGTAGCNLGCRFCQNWDISTSRQMDRLMDTAGPRAIADTAHAHGCRSVAVTYNDPVIFTEYAIDSAIACRERGLQTVAVTAGYVHPEARRDLFSVMTAANVDLKGFTETFYRQQTGAHLRAVLDTLVYLRAETTVWLELTTLLIPGFNDSDAELRAMCHWVVTELGPDVPHHFTAFHPDHRMADVARTPSQTLLRARDIAGEAGELFAYTGNARLPAGDTTHCPGCTTAVIEREGYTLRSYRLDEAGRCLACATEIPGRFDPQPGAFGSRRIPVTIRG
jgi:pyruvate formate lyase activating enzyme